MAGTTTISIQLRGFAEFRRALASGNALAEREVQKAAFSSALAVSGKAKEYAPVKTGNLRRSITYAVEGSKGIVGTNVSYAPFLEFGTKGHGPKSAPFLSFEIDGKRINTKWVRGIEPRFFFKRAIENSVDTITKAFQAAIDAVITHLKS